MIIGSGITKVNYNENRKGTALVYHRLSGCEG